MLPKLNLADYYSLCNEILEELTSFHVKCRLLIHMFYCKSKQQVDGDGKKPGHYP